MSQPITLHVMLDDVPDICNALQNQIRLCERQRTICQAEGSTELVAYWGEKVWSLENLRRHLRRIIETAHDEEIGS